MQRLEVSGAVRSIYGSLGVKRLNFHIRKLHILSLSLSHTHIHTHTHTQTHTHTHKHTHTHTHTHTFFFVSLPTSLARSFSLAHNITLMIISFLISDFSSINAPRCVYKIMFVFVFVFLISEWTVLILFSVKHVSAS